jgi:hypothetical protein
MFHFNLKRGNNQEEKGKKSEDRRQRTEDGRRKTEDGKSEGWCAQSVMRWAQSEYYDKRCTQRHAPSPWPPEVKSFLIFSPEEILF